MGPLSYLSTAAPLFLRIVDALRAQGLDPGELAHSQPAARPGLLRESRLLPPAPCTRRCGSTPTVALSCAVPMLPMARTMPMPGRRWLSSGAARCNACSANPDCPGAARTARIKPVAAVAKAQRLAHPCAACATCSTPVIRNRCCCAQKQRPVLKIPIHLENAVSKAPSASVLGPYTVMTTISGSTSAFRMPSMATRVPVRPAGQVVQAPW